MHASGNTGTTDDDAAFLPGDAMRIGLASAAFFMILCSYYILRPVRDDMAVQFGADRVQWLFTGTLALALLVVPAFGWIVNRMRRALVLPLVYGFLIINLAGFWMLFSTRAASGISAAGFFAWLSVFNLFVVSLFWSELSDCFSTVDSHRLYGYIAAGGTAGALAGPLLTAVLATQVSTASLIGMSCVLLAGAALCMIILRARRSAGTQDHARPVTGSILAGIPLAMGGSLRGVALLVICYTTVSTALYVEIIDLAGKAYAVSGERKAFFARIDLLVNGLSLLLQLFGTRKIVQRYGLRLALPLVPLLVLAGLGLLTVWGTIIGFAIVQTVHRIGEYAVGRPGREMIYTTVDAERRYKAKNFIDLALYRANDAASAWLIAAVRGIGLSAIVVVGIPAAIAWLYTASKVGQRHDHTNRSRQSEST